MSTIQIDLTLALDPKRATALRYWLEHGYDVQSITLGPLGILNEESSVHIPVVETQFAVTDQWTWPIP